jgi:hypothetical protein
MTPDNLMLAEVPLGKIIRIVLLTVLSGLADAQSFVHAAQAFQATAISISDLRLTVIYFGVGLISYLFAVQGLMRIGMAAPELHMLFWFGVTIIGVALLSGKFSQWAGIDRLVGVAVVLGIAWLIFRVE